MIPLRIKIPDIGEMLQKMVNNIDYDTMITVRTLMS